MNRQEAIARLEQARKLLEPVLENSEQLLSEDDFGEIIGNIIDALNEYAEKLCDADTIEVEYQELACA